jgi:hypothetical protein
MHVAMVTTAVRRVRPGVKPSATGCALKGNTVAVNVLGDSLPPAVHAHDAGAPPDARSRRIWSIRAMTASSCAMAASLERWDSRR